MKKIAFLMLFVVGFVFSQQINHTWGQKTDGTYYTASGYPDADSLESINIIFDLQDYYFMDFNPYSHNSGTALLNSDAMFIGTFWYRVDADQATDSTNLHIEVYPGGFVYDDSDGTRIESSEYNFSSTAVTLLDTASVTNRGDIEWSYVNVYLDASAKQLPPELIKLELSFDLQSFDGGSAGDVYWDFVYPAVYEREQRHRTTSRSSGENKKRQKSLK